MVTKTPKQIDHLLPERYPVPDLFVCDVSDAVLKDVMSEMEHPFYALSKKPDTTTRRYEHNGQWIEITPSGEGQATIYDKDILIYCISQIMAKLNREEAVSKRVRINSHELLMFCNRGTAGKDYAALSGALTRLGGTMIKTNIRVSDDEEDILHFSLIDKATIRRKMGMDGRLLWVDVTLSDWVFDAIRENEVLTLHRDYFRLRKPLERRMYELARKHCGQQDQWTAYLSLLHKKSGSKSPMKRFRQLVKNTAKHDLLPDYHVLFDVEQDKVTFLNRGTMPIEKEKIWDGRLSPDIFEKVGKLRTGLDKYHLESQFRSWIAKQGISPKNPDGMFLTFCKTAKKKRSQGQLF